MPEPQWKGYIKTYEKSTMMQCRILKEIDYLNIYTTLRQQRDALIAKIFQVCNMRIYPGLNFENDSSSSRREY